LVSFALQWAGVIFVACVAVALWRLWRADYTDRNGRALRASGAPLASNEGHSVAAIRPLPEVLAELDSLIGLAEVKAEIRKQVENAAAQEKWVALQKQLRQSAHIENL